ncbi:MAG: hypothetical protein Q9M97_01580 [Candidatus Gracilibacteria bacterium]|nr:hypothetical protein [Candidatus Gracilibacteria bacterium]
MKKKEKISIEGSKNIKIGNKEYSISINGNGISSLAGNVFESITLNNGNLIIKANGETVKYGIEKAKPILQTLINSGGYNKKIEGKPATLTIKKI